ncbi:MAG: hypothetical protein FWD47_04120 [Treponema sp.]|nr:hypothetical protein [Treponema sp.]
MIRTSPLVESNIIINEDIIGKMVLVSSHRDIMLLYAFGNYFYDDIRKILNSISEINIYNSEGIQVLNTDEIKDRIERQINRSHNYLRGSFFININPNY